MVFLKSFGIFFIVVSVFILIAFIFVITTIVARLSRRRQQSKINQASPVLTVDAAVVTKRADVYHYSHDTLSDNMHNMGSSTTYYATFEVASGDRMEFQVRDTEYGMLVDQDTGKLTFQGTRFLGFERGRQ